MNTRQRARLCVYRLATVFMFDNLDAASVHITVCVCPSRISRNVHWLVFALGRRVAEAPRERGAEREAVWMTDVKDVIERYLLYGGRRTLASRRRMCSLADLYLCNVA